MLMKEPNLGDVEVKLAGVTRFAVVKKIWIKVNETVNEYLF